MVIKIAINGKARSGKNTFASFLCKAMDDSILKHDQYGKLLPLQISSQQYVTLAFADAIKQAVMKIFPNSNREYLWGSSELRSKIIPGTDRTYRDFIIDLGALARKYNPNVWIDVTLHEAEQSQKPMIVISDCRFKNEFNKLKELGYTIIRIKRPNEEYVINDISEKDLDDVPDSDFNYVVINDCSLEELQQKAQDIFVQLKLNQLGIP